jgi:hypothetical protein
MVRRLFGKCTATFPGYGDFKKANFEVSVTWKGCGTSRAALFIVSGRRNAT